ncbi:hypothetical protein D3C84_1039710 [compost metagenome]
MKKWIISCILLSTVILSSACSSGVSTNSEYSEPADDVHSVIEDMEATIYEMDERISELESQNEDLQYELEDVESRLTDVELDQDLDF